MKRLLIFAVAILLFAGCEGDPGPVGPTGNANVLTGTISPTNSEWLWMGYYDLRVSTGTWISYTTRYVDIPVAEITPEIISTGAILVSFEAHPGNYNWLPLPFQMSGFSHEYMITIVYGVSEGAIRLHYFNMPTSSNATLPDLAAFTIPTYTFKYTVIEGTALQAIAADGIDISDHDSVTEYLASR